MGKGSGVGSGSFSRGIRRRYGDVTCSKAGGALIHVGKSNGAGTTYGSIVLLVTN